MLEGGIWWNKVNRREELNGDGDDDVHDDSYKYIS